MAEERLKTPTVELVKEYAEKFDQSYPLGEGAKRRMIEAFPCNTNKHEVLAKVIVLNKIYSTNILEPYRMALHIAEIPMLDVRVKQGDLGLIDEIMKLEVPKKDGGAKVIKFYSFATKYCSWHNETAYPIFDSRVEWMLCNYRYQWQSELDNLGTFKWQELHEYAFFVDVLDKFRSLFKLQEVDARMLDKFLYQYSLEVMPHKAE